MSTEGSAAFLKKSSKKLLLRWAIGFGAFTTHDPAYKSFLVLFFKKEPLTRAR
jgi:hypothetical protein